MHFLFFFVKDNQKDILTAKHAEFHSFLDDVLLSFAKSHVGLSLSFDFFQTLSSL
tara:strand:- start:208 stop:372 length:165 start_codon:yes stop_codon:yes gene_type:complete